MIAKLPKQDVLAFGCSLHESLIARKLNSINGRDAHEQEMGGSFTGIVLGPGWSRLDDRRRPGCHGGNHN